MNPTPAAAPAKKKNVSLFIILAIVAVGGCCVFGIIAAIAIPNYVRYVGKAKQSEAKLNIKSLYSAQKAHFAELDAYSTNASELGLLPGTRFTCFVTPTSSVASTTVPATTYEQLHLSADNQPGVVGECPSCEFTAVCAGNIDSDDTLDVWSISSVDRACGKAGVPCNDVNDLEQ